MMKKATAAIQNTQRDYLLFLLAACISWRSSNRSAEFRINQKKLDQKTARLYSVSGIYAAKACRPLPS